MTESGGTPEFKIADSVCWVRDRVGFIVVDDEQKTHRILTGVEAAVWSWLTLDYKLEQLVRFLVALLSITPEEAEVQLNQIVSQWRREGFLL